MCEVQINSWKLSGSFVLGDDNYQFAENMLNRNGELLVSYDYSRGVMGVGETFSIFNPANEFLYALRPSGTILSARFTLSAAPAKLCEISRPYFSRRFQLGCVKMCRQNSRCSAFGLR